MLLRHCEPGDHYVPASEAPLHRIVQAGPDAGRRVYACRVHAQQDVRDAGPAAVLIGHRDTAPTIAVQEAP